MRRCASIGSTLVLGTALLVLAAGIAAAAGGALKLAVAPEHPQATLATSSRVRLTVQDPENQPRALAEPITVRIEAIFPSGALQARELTIPAGQQGASVEFRWDEPGIVELRAVHERLLEGESLILVQPPETERPDLVGANAPESARAPAGGARAARPGPLGELLPVPTTSGARLPAPTRAEGARLPSPSPRVESTSSTPPARLTLRAAPQRRILADETDAATIYAFLDREASRDVSVRLSATLGSVAPKPILIRAGEAVGHSQWTSSDVGAAIAAFEGASPPVDFSGESLRIDFAPPIHRIELDPSPSSISLLEAASIVVRLSRADGVPQATDYERNVRLTLEGPGELAADELTIAAGQSSARTQLRPTGVGVINLSASTTGLPRVDNHVEVGFPLVVLTLSLLGGGAGGWLAMLTQRPARRARIVVGIVTGLVVYWAFLFGLVEVPPGAALHPLGAFALPTLGGFLGTQAFTWVLRRLGIKV